MTSQCPRCSKRVFFAERKQSLGQAWHRQCLTCEACGKVLNPGQHAERKGVPYCDVPCYKSLFGPKLYGFGSQVESHDYSPRSERKDKGSKECEVTVASLNKMNISMSTPRIDGRSPKVTQQQLKELEEKLKIHNDVHLQNFISLIEKDGHVTLEGVLRVHWGVQTSIQFKKDDSNETTPFTARLRDRRVNKSRSFHSDLYADTDSISEQPVIKDPFDTLKSSGIPREISSQQLLAVKMKRGQFHTIKEQKIRRRVSINGHYYKRETSNDFTPAFGSVTQVFVGSHLRTPEVIRRLLDKFKIENTPAQFALYMVKANGEMWPLVGSEYPLMERVNLVDPTARIFLMDKPHQVSMTNDSVETNTEDRTPVTLSDVWQPVETLHTNAVIKKIPDELTGFLCLPDAMLYGFIAMFNQEQKQALDEIKAKYDALRKDIMRLMSEKQLTEETYL